jgi:hypothetical protein
LKNKEVLSMPIGNGFISLAKETSFGVKNNTPDLYLPVKSAELTTDPQVYYPEEIRASRAKTKGIPMGKKHEGSLEMDVEPVSIGHLLLAALGSVQTDGTAAPYTHKFTPGAVLPSFTFTKFDTVMTQVASGAKVDTLTLAIEAGGDGVMTAEAEMFIQSVEDGAAAVPSYSDKSPFSFHQVTVTKGGTTNDDIKSVEFEITNNLKDDNYTLRKSQDVKEINEGMREVTGSIEMNFKNKAAYLAFMNDEKDSLTLTFDAGSDQLIVEIPVMSYDGFEVPMGGADDEVTASLEFTALEDPDKGYEIQVTLINTVSNY